MEDVFFARVFDTGVKTIEHKLFTIHCPDGTLAIDCLVSKLAAGIIISALNNLMVIRDNDDVSPRLIASMCIQEIDEVKPKNIKL
jgi:hypothetical protein